MNIDSDILTNGSSIVLLLGGLAFFIFTWLNASEPQKRQYIEDLVHEAQQRFLDKSGPERLEYVLSEFKRRFPRFPDNIARTIAEAAVKRMKLDEGYTFGPLLEGELNVTVDDEPSTDIPITTPAAPATTQRLPL